MSKHRGRFDWLFRTRNGVVLIVLLGLAIALAGVMASDAGRARLLQLAEKVGLHKEAEHELVPMMDEEGKILYWTCTMHPSVRAADPGTCPI